MKENKDLSLSTLSLADFQLPLRPGHGEKGTVIHLRTNYMKMTINAAQKLFKYTISLTAKYKEPRKEKVTKQGQKQEQKPVEPKPGSRKRRRALALLFQHPDFQRIGHGVATDYAQTIITSKELPLDEDGTKEYIIVYCEVEEQEPASNPVIYTFKLSYGGLIPTAELVRYLASSTTDPSDSTAMEDAIQALNISKALF